MYVAVDIGGSNIRIGAFEEPDKIIKSAVFKVGEDFDASIKKIVNEIKKLSNGGKIDGIGVCVPGSVDTNKGIIIDAGNLAGWNNKPLRKTLEAVFKTKIILAHDVVCAALGEATVGHGQNLDRFTFLIWGTGFGGATVEKIADKFKIKQIEPGHQIIEANGPKCTCGQNGCLEAYIGGWALEKNHGKDYSKIGDDQWEQIAQKAAQGIINLTLINPAPVLIFGGGVVSKQPHLLDRIRKMLEEKQKVFKKPEFKLSQKGEDVSLFGCRALFLEKLIS